VIAALTSDDLMRRAGLPLPLDVARALRPEEREDLLRVIAERPLAELATQEPRTGYIQASVPQAVSTLIEWGLDALPVVDREGAFAGLFGVEQALRAALEAGRGADGAVQDSEAPPPVRLLMQTSVPAIPAAMGAAEALGRVLAAPERFVLVVEDGRPAGVIDAAGVLAQLEAPLRYEWLQGLRAPAAPPAFAGAPPELTAAGLSAPATTINELATEDAATRLLLEQGCARLVVVNEAGQLAGLLGRRALLRALSQEHV
jgi:CBS-domain-containing membrane protein